MKSPSLTMNDGKTIPQIGFGTWMLKNEKECKQAVTKALEVGYRHIDTAQIYGNEEFIGDVLAASKIPRKEIFLTTKIWNDNMFWDDLPVSFAESLKKLHIDYVDLLLLHFPVTELRRPAWTQMEDLQKSGKVKSIGVSNYTIEHLKELLSECKIKPAVNQVELHVYLQQPELVEFCRQHGIVLEAYSPLAHGYRLDDPVITKIAQKYGKSNAQIMIRWCVQKGFVVLPKSATPRRISENFEVFDFELTPTDMKAIEKLNQNLRTCWDPTHVA